MNFSCRVMWDVFVKEQEKYPEDTSLKEQVDEMKKDHGEVRLWPKMRRGSKFVPRKKTHSHGG